ncbi:MAG: Flp pilus assembly complex ATPase component TadA, partial [Lentisphaeria bacterium]|nr:Flp pilus assembly complex ATPase component TadA [Lentisphaeria bacterium]
MQLIVYGKNNVPVLTRELPDDRRKMTIGRQDDCAVRLSGDTCVSRHHASICFDGTAVYLEDMGSSGGTAVNGTSLQKGVPTFVRPGDRIQIGSFVMAVAGDANAASAASEPFAGQAQDNPPKAPAPDQSPESEYDPELEQAQEKFKREFGDFSVLYNDKTMKLIEKIHEDVLRKMNWTADSVKMANNQEERAKVEQILDVVLNERGHEIPGSLSKAMLRQTMIDQIFGYGPLSRLLKSPDITEIMINGPDCIFVEYKVKSNKAKCFQTAARFFNEHQLISVIQRIVEPLGRRVDKSSPMVDARLPDGSRVNVIIPPLALQGPSVTIRKFPEHKLTIEDLIQYNSLTREMALFLEEAVKAKKNILVAGGTGSGKTTLLNVLSLFIPAKERVITV